MYMSLLHAYTSLLHGSLDIFGGPRKQGSLVCITYTIVWHIQSYAREQRKAEYVKQLCMWYTLKSPTLRARAEKGKLTSMSLLCAYSMSLLYACKSGRIVSEVRTRSAKDRIIHTSLLYAYKSVMHTYRCLLTWQVELSLRCARDQRKTESFIRLFYTHTSLLCTHIGVFWHGRSNCLWGAHEISERQNHLYVSSIRIQVCYAHI